MAFSSSTEEILKRILGRGYQIHPDALKILEARGEAKALEILNTFSQKFPNAIVIQAEQVEELLEKPSFAKEREPSEFLPALRGGITQIYDGSGLIQRCPKCNRWIIDNFCMVHSDVEGIWDLRIKARFENENERCTLIFKREVTEEIVGITLEEAIKLGEAGTLARIRQAVLGKRFEIEGDRLKGGNNFLVKAIREVK